jgi:hypothetical protein
MALLNHSLKRKLLAALAVAAVIAGGTIAVIEATGRSGSRGRASRVAKHGGRAYPGGRGDIPVAASYLGLTTAQLRGELAAGRTLAQVASSTPGKSTERLIDAIIAARKANLEAAVAAGELTQASETAALSSLPARVKLRVNRLGGYGLAAGGGSVPGLAPAAAYLGLSAEQLRTEQQSGRSLAQLANGTSGKSAAGLIAALVADRKATLAAAVAAGRMTQARARKVLAHLDQRIAAEVNGAGQQPPK